MKNIPRLFLVLFLLLILIACQRDVKATERAGHQTVVYDGKIWIIGGQGGFGNPLRNDVHYSTDGLTWNEATTHADFSARVNHVAIVFENKIWVIGGATKIDLSSGTNDVYYSDDGMNWHIATKKAAFEPRDGHTALVYKNKMWVIGGFGGTYDDFKKTYNDVYYSTNGVDWYPATTNAAFSPRHGHSSVVYDNKMWVIGGTGRNGRTNDVYYSSDGVNWYAATVNATFSPRQYHKTLVYNGKMWVIGGLSDEGGKNDVYYSINGTDWFVATTNVAFSPRYGYATVVYDNKMWIIGRASAIGHSSDVYDSIDGITWTNMNP